MSAVILDGATVQLRPNPVGGTTSEQYAIDIFKPYIMSQLNVADIVWDTYMHKMDSLKSSTRKKRGNGIRRRVIPSTAVRKRGKISYELTTKNKNYSTISPRVVRLGR